MANEDHNVRESFESFFLRHARGAGPSASTALPLSAGAAARIFAPETPAPQEAPDPLLSKLTTEELALLKKHPELEKDLRAEHGRLTADCEKASEVQRNLATARSIHDARDALRAAAARIVAESGNP